MFPLKDHNPTSTVPLVTIGLVVLNTMVMLWLSTLGSGAQQAATIQHGFIPARIEQLSNPNLLIQVPLPAELAVYRGQVVQLPPKKLNLPPATVPILASILTSMFMHGGWMHLAGNMWFLWVFGNNIEDRLGHALYLLLYLVGGLLATASHWAFDPHSTIPVVGASGAVATILGAYAVTFPKATISTLIFFGFITVIEIPALAWLGVWIGGQLVDAYFNPNMGVAVWAHIGGFAAGALLMTIASFGLSPPVIASREEPSLQIHEPPHYEP